MNKKAVIYARVSTDEQAERGTSIESQLEVCRQYAEENSLKVVGEYTDSYSGTTLDRPGLNELLDILEQGKASAVVVLTEDRLSRNYPKTVLLKSQFADQGIDLHFTDSGMVDHSFEWMILGAFKEISAHNEISTFIRRAKRGRDDKVRKQKKPVLGGATPFGYRKVGLRKEAELIIDEEEALIIREIFELYTTGNGYEGPISLRAIANHFNESGIIPPKKRKNSVNYWTPNRIQRILRNELYAGVYHWGKTRMVKKGYQQQGKRVKQLQEDWIRLDVPELAIVDKETYDLTQIRIERNKRLSKRNRKYEYLMTGFLRCGNCGCAVVGHAITRKRRKRIFFYRCGSQFKTYKAKVCTAINKRTIAYKIDNAVWEWLKSILLDKNALEMGLNKLTKNRSQLTDSKIRRLEIVHKLIDDTEKSLQRLVTEMANHGNNIVINAFRNEIDIATIRLNAVIEERDRLEDELKQIEFSDDQRKCILAFAEKIQDKVNDASYNNKRHLLDVLDVQAVLYYENERKWLEITCAIPSNKSVIELHPSAAPVPESRQFLVPDGLRL